MGPYISLTLEIGGWGLVGAWALKGMNMVIGITSRRPIFLREFLKQFFLKRLNSL